MKRLQKLLLAATLAAVPSAMLAEVVTGTVLDESGEPLIGATVFVAGTSKATSTDIDGKFSIDTDGGKSIKVSYVGFTSVSLPISKNKKVYDITLKEDSRNLDELVVVGYGTMKPVGRLHLGQRNAARDGSLVLHPRPALEESSGRRE